MSIRPADKGSPPTPAALEKWPKAPKGFTQAEREWWSRLGVAAMELGTVAAADLPVAARAVQVSARVDAAFLDPNFKATALNALLRLELDYWKQLGLSPQSRRAVTPLPNDKAEESGFEDIE